MTSRTPARSWVRFLSGTQNFPLSHARVMLINSPSHFTQQYIMLCLMSGWKKLDMVRVSSCQNILKYRIVIDYVTS